MSKEELRVLVNVVGTEYRIGRKVRSVKGPRRERLRVGGVTVGKGGVEEMYKLEDERLVRSHLQMVVGGRAMVMMMVKGIVLLVIGEYFLRIWRRFYGIVIHSLFLRLGEVFGDFGVSSYQPDRYLDKERNY